MQNMPLLNVFLKNSLSMLLIIWFLNVKSNNLLKYISFVSCVYIQTWFFKSMFFSEMKKKKKMWFKCIGDLIIKPSCQNPWEAKTITQIFSNVWI